MSVKPINPNAALYIKLGRGGRWETDCIARKGTLRLGYVEVSHDLCLQGKWDEVLEELKAIGKDQGAATRDANQVRFFYEANDQVLWVTFYGDRLYWCFSKPEVRLLPGKSKSKIRPVIGQWSSVDINGRPLLTSQLSGKLLSMQGFRGTICRVKEFEYLKQKINGHVPKEVEEAQAALLGLERKIETVIRRLHWRDFEVLIDLIFRQAGWQRVSELGKTLKTLDLDLLSPITSERYGVQIKSKADLADLQHYQQEFADMQSYNRLYFVVHTPSRDLAQAETAEDIELWLPQDIAHWVVKHGLVDWVLGKAS